MVDDSTMMISTVPQAWGRIWLAAYIVASLSVCSGAGPASDTGSADLADRARSQAAADGQLDLEALLTPVPEYETRGRNLFAYGAARVQASTAPAAIVRPAVPTLTTGRPTGGTPAPAGPQGRRIDVKYAGFVEKPVEGNKKKKYAIFIDDGKYILTGAEGDSLGSFTIVRIGVESVTVSPTGTTSTQRIPLQSN